MTEFHQTYISDALGDRDDRFRFWGQKIKDQSHSGLKYDKNGTLGLVCSISWKFVSHIFTKHMWAVHYGTDECIRVLDQGGITRTGNTLQAEAHSTWWSAVVGVFTRGSIYAVARICHANSVCLSVRLSVTRVICVKTAERVIKILSPSERPIILVFRHQGSLRKSRGFTPNGGAKYKGSSNFRPICGYLGNGKR